jgi:hypothetical protein
MAFVTITEAAKLVRRSRRTLYRDIDNGRLSKTVDAAGATTIDTSELLRVYGTLYREEEEVNHDKSTDSTVDDFVELVDRWEHSQKALPKGNGAPAPSSQVQILEERIKSLEHVLEVEATLRKVKDEVTNELRARLEDKDRVIKILENKVILLGYDGPEGQNMLTKRKGFLFRLFKMN